jgi:drug/metabolite transporter (DMT)-like permease
MLSPRLLGVALVVVSAASFGAMGVLARIAYDDGAEPVAVLTCRFALAAACFAVLRSLRSPSPLSRRTVLGLVVMGVCYFAQSFCYFTAIDHAPPGLVALLLYSFPVLVVLGSVVLLGMALTRRLIVACCIALGGMAFVVWPSVGSGDPVGIAFGLAAAVVYAGYILLGTRVMEDADPLSASTVIMTTAAAGYIVVYVVRALAGPAPSMPHGRDGWLAIVAIALLCTVIAGVAFLAGLARVGPADAATISTVEPVVSVVLSAIVTGEAITGWTVAGGVLVLGAVVTLSRSAPSPLVEPAPAA